VYVQLTSFVVQLGNLVWD